MGFIFMFQLYGIPQHFGLFYAMGLSLMMEGILSGCYHVCPSYSNYQFGEEIGEFWSLSLTENLASSFVI